MSTIVEYRSKLYVLCKGAPEVLRSLLNEVPAGFDMNLDNFTKSGFRVLCGAFKYLGLVSEADQILCQSRSVLESSLTFSAFMVFENKLKSATSDVILELNFAGIKSIMATGDNLLTALHVARESNLVPRDVPIYYAVENGQLWTLAHGSPSDYPESLHMQSLLRRLDTDNELILALSGDAVLSLKDGDQDVFSRVETCFEAF